MKKSISKILLAILLVFPMSVKAAPSGSLSCSVSSSTVHVGDTVTVRVSGSSSDAMWDTTMGYSGRVISKTGGNDVRTVGTDFVTSVSYTYTFKAISEGSETISVNSDISDYYGEKSHPSTSCTINVVSQSNNSTGNSGTTTRQNISNPEKSDLSEDNSLKSLKIGDYKLTPEFNSDNLEYDVLIKSDDKLTVNVTAETNDEKASIKGLGEKELELGLNKIEIVVTAENGSERTYTIKATVTEKNPIIVKVDSKKYTLLRKLTGIDAPNGFEKATMKIDGKEVEVFKNKKINYTLVGLIDSDNNTSLYVYKNNKYFKYVPLKSNSLNLIILDEKVKKVPYRYKKTTFVIDNTNVNGYVFDSVSDFRLVYALNVDTNYKGFYLYDLSENTFQRFNNRQVEIYLDLIKKCKIAFLGAGAFILLLLFTLLCNKISNHSLKKKLNNYNVNEDLEKQLTNKIKVDKKALKKKEKEMKKAQKKQKTFLDE